MIRLTIAQKKALIEYLLASAGKGPFEDLDVFTTVEVDVNYDEYVKSANKFVNEVREFALEKFTNLPVPSKSIKLDNLDHLLGNPIFAIETNIVSLRKRIVLKNTEGSLDILDSIEKSLETMKEVLHNLKEST